MFKFRNLSWRKVRKTTRKKVPVPTKTPKSFSIARIRAVGLKALGARKGGGEAPVFE